MERKRDYHQRAERIATKQSAGHNPQDYSHDSIHQRAFDLVGRVYDLEHPWSHPLLLTKVAARRVLRTTGYTVGFLTEKTFGWILSKIF